MKALIILLAALTGAKAMAQTATRPADLTAECEAFLTQLEGTDFKYGWITSKEKPGPPDSKNLDIFFYYRLDSITTPMVLFNGGPSSPGHNYLSWVSKLPGSFILLDQRGTGCSTAYPVKEKNKVSEYAYWGSTGIVHDSEKIREHLGFEKWSVWGQSFGSIIVQRYVELFPESLVRAGSYTGVTPNIQIDEHKSLTPVWDMRLAYQFRTLVEYFKRHPKDKDLVKKILRERRCRPNEAYLCGAQALHFGTIGFMSRWETISLELEKISQGPRWETGNPIVILNDESSFDELYELAEEMLEFTDESVAMSFIMGHLVNRMMWLESLGEDHRLVNSYKTRRSSLKDLDEDFHFMLESDGISRSFYRYHHDPKFRKSYNRVTEQVLRTGINPINNQTIRNNLESYPDLDYTVWSGEFDFYFPPEMIAMAAKQMGPRVTYIPIKGIGHDYTTPEVFEYISQEAWKLK